MKVASPRIDDAAIRARMEATQRIVEIILALPGGDRTVVLDHARCLIEGAPSEPVPVPVSGHNPASSAMPGAR